METEAKKVFERISDEVYKMILKEISSEYEKEILEKINNDEWQCIKAVHENNNKKKDKSKFLIDAFEEWKREYKVSYVSSNFSVPLSFDGKSRNFRIKQDEKGEKLIIQHTEYNDNMGDKEQYHNTIYKQINDIISLIESFENGQKAETQRQELNKKEQNRVKKIQNYVKNILMFFLIGAMPLILIINKFCSDCNKWSEFLVGIFLGSCAIWAKAILKHLLKGFRLTEPLLFVTIFIFSMFFIVFFLAFSAEISSILGTEIKLNEKVVAWFVLSSALLSVLMDAAEDRIFKSENN